MDVTLPSGGTVTLLDIGKLKARHRRAIQEHMGSGNTFDAAGNLDRSRVFVVAAGLDAAVAQMVITAWTLPYAPGHPIPALDPTGWEDVLELDDMTALEEHLAEYRAKLLLRRDGAEPELREDGTPDPEGPTGRHAEPAPSSPEAPSELPTATSSVDGTAP